MPNGFLEALRMNNIFGQSAPIFQTPRIRIPQEYQDLIGQAQSRQQTPITGALPRIADQIGQPERESQGMRTVYDPFSLSDYRQQTLALRERELEQRGKTAEENLGIRKQQLNIQKFKANNPNLRIVMPRGGNVMAIDPQTGETRDLGIPVGSLSEQERLDLQQDYQRERISLGGEEARETARARAEEQRQTAQETKWSPPVQTFGNDGKPGPVIQTNLVTGEVRQVEVPGVLRTQPPGAIRDRIIERTIQDPDNPDRTIRVRINLDTNEVEPLAVKPTTTPERPPAVVPRTELEEGREVANRAQRAKNSNPSWNKWIKIEPGGRITITRPSMFSEPGGVPSLRPSKAEYDQMNQAIHGTIPPGQTPGRDRGAPPAGRVRVIGPNNQTGTVTEEDARNLPPGWKRQ